VIPPLAIQHFTERQRQLIHDSYDQAWQRGVKSYTPDADPEEPTPEHQHRGEEATLTGLTLLRARTYRAYQPPGSPDFERRQIALAGALKSTEKMAGELAQLSPEQEHVEEAQLELEAGNADTDFGAEGLGLAALANAVAQWAESNAYRLDAGASVAWAAEQAGYAEAADTDGKLLQWIDEGDDKVCGDCQALDELGPLPLADFPTMPGDGATECDAGCRCSLEAVDIESLPSDQLAPLGEEENTVLDKIAGQVQERMDNLAPNFAVTG